MTVSQKLLELVYIMLTLLKNNWRTSTKSILLNPSNPIVNSLNTKTSRLINFFQTISSNPKCQANTQQTIQNSYSRWSVRSYEQKLECNLKTSFLVKCKEHILEQIKQKNNKSNHKDVNILPKNIFLNLLNGISYRPCHYAKKQICLTFSSIFITCLNKNLKLPKNILFSILRKGQKLNTMLVVQPKELIIDKLKQHNYQQDHQMFAILTAIAVRQFILLNKTPEEKLLIKNPIMHTYTSQIQLYPFFTYYQPVNRNDRQSSQILLTQKICILFISSIEIFSLYILLYIYLSSNAFQNSHQATQTNQKAFSSYITQQQLSQSSSYKVLLSIRKQRQSQLNIRISQIKKRKQQSKIKCNFFWKQYHRCGQICCSNLRSNVFRIFCNSEDLCTPC